MEAKGSVVRETAANLTAQKTRMSSSSCGGLEGKRETDKQRLEAKETEIESRRDRDIEGGSEQMNNCLMSSA